MCLYCCNLVLIWLASSWCINCVLDILLGRLLLEVWLFVWCGKKLYLWYQIGDYVRGISRVFLKCFTNLCTTEKGIVCHKKYIANKTHLYIAFKTHQFIALKTHQSFALKTHQSITLKTHQSIALKTRQSFTLKTHQWITLKTHQSIALKTHQSISLKTH